MAENDEKKIIIDEDWKQEAQRDKEKLVEQEKAKEAEKAEKAEVQERPVLPDADISSLVNMLATQAFMALGLIRMKEGDEPTIDLEMAKFNIDTLNVIEEKTKGNLSDDEKEMLDGVLAQLRMAFVNAGK